MFRKAQQTVAHQSTLPSGFLGNRDLKGLQEIINTEKEFVKSNSRSAQDFHKSSEALKTWAQGEGEDLQDVLGKLSLLFDHYATAQGRFNTHLSTIRQHFKSIRTREESLAELRARKRALGSKIDGVEKKLHKMSPENKELPKTTLQLKELRAEMDSMRNDLAAEEAAIGDFKRRTSKEAMGIKCAGLLEFAEKMTVVAEAGKLLLEEIPLDTTDPGMPREKYLGMERTDELLHEATQSIADVGFAPSGPSAGVRRPDTSHLQNNNNNINNDYDDSGMGYYDDGARNGPDGENERGYEYDSSAAWNQSGAGTDMYAQEADGDRFALRDPRLHDSQSMTGSGQRFGEDGAPQITTPIYESHSLASANRNRPMSNSGLGSTQQGANSNDSAADSWSARQERGAVPISRPHGSGPTPIAERFQSRSPDEQQVGGTGLRIVPNSSNDSLQDSAPVMPPSTLPRLSTPPQDGNFGYEQSADQSAYRGIAGPSTPSGAAANGRTPASTAAQDDESYFQSVGSTRAAQQAIRRPTSPGVAGNTARPFSSTIGNEGEGRKMTAAAFRKGFGRVPSSQAGAGQYGASTTSLGAAIARPSSAAGSSFAQAHPPPPVAGSGENGEHMRSSSEVAPLSIRKRGGGGPPSASYEYGGGAYASQRPPQHGGQDGPAPPYDGPPPAPQHDVYGGMTGNDDAYGGYTQPHHDQRVDPYYAQPPQPWMQQGGGSPIGSRPTSAAGWRQVPQ